MNPKQEAPRSGNPMDRRPNAADPVEERQPLPPRPDGAVSIGACRSLAVTSVSEGLIVEPALDSYLQVRSF